MEQNLDFKLNRVTSVVDEMKQNLRLDSNAPIEEVSAATNLKTLLNIFVQTEEPECKDGVWLQTEPFDYVDFTVDEDMHIVGDMEGIDKWPKDTMPYQYNSGSTGDSTGYYLTYNATVYYFPYNNYTTESWVTLSKIPVSIHAYDGYVYVLHSDGTFQRINESTKEVESLPKLPKTSSQRYYIAGVGHCLYILVPGDTQEITVYNIDTQEFSTAPGPKKYLKSSLSGSINSLPVWNGKIMVPHWTSGAGYSNYSTLWFDPQTNIWSGAPSCAAKEMAGLVIIGTDLYILGRGKKLYKVDLITNTEVEIKLPFEIDVNDDGIFNCNDQLVYHSTKTRRTHTFASDTSTYDHDTIVIVQGRYKETNYLITLYNVPKTGVGNFKWPFSDILPYINGEFKTGIPTYYGDGTKWIKFKN